MMHKHNFLWRTPRHHFILGLAFAALLSGGAYTVVGQPPVSFAELKPVEPNDSLRREIQHSIDTGLAWLKTQQAPTGSWSNADYPALTALVMTAWLGDPSRHGRPLDGSTEDEALRRAHVYLVGCAQPDGGIYRKGLGNYNTSISMIALLAEHAPGNDALLRRARGFVISGQKHGSPGDPDDGGMGYDPGSGGHCDISNTSYAMEALYYTQGLRATATQEVAREPDLDWKAAIGFLEHCQNLRDHNNQAWASDDSQNKGGFVYAPGKSSAGETSLAENRKALRSYGSTSYAGLLSYIYADLKKDDPRIEAAREWLRVNYTLEENPGMGKAGLYYYYELMAKALTAYGADDLLTVSGRKVNWREELATKLVNLQNKDGFWQNENGRWWEKDPVLSTAYSLLALEFLYGKL